MIHLIVMLLFPQRGSIISIDGGWRISFMASYGAVEGFPQSIGLFARWNVPLDSLLLAIDDARLKQIASLEYQDVEFDLYPPSLVHIDKDTLQIGIDDFIRSHLDEDLSISVLADKVGFSVNHFMRTFHREIGVTPHRYITRLRVELAEQLVTTADLPLNSIAMRCGFASNSHMTAMTGSPPSHPKRMQSTQKHLSRRLVLQVERRN